MAFVSSPLRRRAPFTPVDGAAAQEAVRLCIGAGGERHRAASFVRL